MMGTVNCCYLVTLQYRPSEGEWISIQGLTEGEVVNDD